MPASISELLASATVDYTAYEEMYKHLHRNPELSNQENETAAFIVAHLKQLGGVFELFTGIGGTGVAAVFKNNNKHGQDEKGQTVLIRSDMDALPVEEKTGLKYASTQKMRDADGNERSVAHSCGHDIHMTCLLAAAEKLVKLKNSWSGTLVLVFQQAEERGTGAQAMVNGGLYDKVPIPDIVLGQHVMPLRAGTLNLRSGTIMAACDSFKITLFGRGGHGSTPHVAVDPVVMAANLITRLQTIVSRELDPAETAVVTVGTVHVGFAENIIVDRGEIGVDIRSTNVRTRDKIVASIKRMARAEALASGADREPEVVQTRSFPPTDNDAESTEKLSAAFHAYAGKEDFDGETKRVMMAEDVSILATSHGRPCVFWLLGGIDHELWDAHHRRKEGIPAPTGMIPGNHSDLFAPAIQPTLTVGTDALCVAALTFLRTDGL